MRISWFRDAYRQWLDTVDYIYTEYGQRAMETFIQETDRTEKDLSAFPQIGKVEPLLSDRTKLYRSIVLTRHNKLIYFIEDDTLNIVAFWDTRREPEAQAAGVK